MNLKIYSNFDLNHPCSFFYIRKSLYFLYARINEKAANQKANVMWRHIEVIFVRTISDFQ